MWVYMKHLRYVYILEICVNSRSKLDLPSILPPPLSLMWYSPSLWGVLPSCQSPESPGLRSPAPPCRRTDTPPRCEAPRCRDAPSPPTTGRGNRPHTSLNTRDNQVTIKFTDDASTPPCQRESENKEVTWVFTLWDGVVQDLLLLLLQLCRGNNKPRENTMRERHLKGRWDSNRKWEEEWRCQRLTGRVKNNKSYK